MLENILKRKKCFKLVCGAGNEDVEEVEKLVALYAKAGANYFDLSAREDILLAAKRGIRRVIPQDKIDQFYLNISVGIKGDPHVSKAEIDLSKCVKCGKCVSVCSNKAVIVKDSVYKINLARCIGCGACCKVCENKAIFYNSNPKSIQEVLPPLIKCGIHSIELHASSKHEDSVSNKWNSINEIFKGILSLCIDRTYLGDFYYLERIRNLIKPRKDYSTIIQADGAPMSGCDDSYETTLQALATAQIVQRANLPVFLMLSGGTNSKTARLAKTFNIKANGVAIGSYARIIVRDYIQRNDFFLNGEVFNKALKKAKKLVDNTIKHLGF